MQTDKNKMEKKNKRQRKINDAFFKLRTYQVYQQGVLLVLLNNHFEITLQIPTKRSVVTHQYFKINELRRGNDSIKVEEYVEQRCKEKYLQDISNGIPEKTARRRYDTNKITEQLHLLIDLSTEFGYRFVSKRTSGKKRCSNC
ncbi:TATA-binding protein-associated phosphoprotein, putative [Entamoeba histolytica HM-3:IMSS]|nr:TATA-binding protein-associated phosphoprotein, putative [Entamoeba histolytica HM-3:IMSS]